jgi:hypothetical protein
MVSELASGAVALGTTAVAAAVACCAALPSLRCAAASACYYVAGEQLPPPCLKPSSMYRPCMLDHDILDRQAVYWLHFSENNVTVCSMLLLSCRTPKWFAFLTARFVVYTVSLAVYGTHMHTVVQTTT